MSKIKVTFENGHIINYKGHTDDIELFEKISRYELENNRYIGMTGFDSTLNFTIERI
jgi:leucyl aminopeptidase (aminopeptidase T)